MTAAVVFAVVTACGGAKKETAAKTASTKPKSGLTARESQWLTSSKLRDVLATVQKDVRRFARTGSIQGSIGDFRVIDPDTGLMGGHECRTRLDRARKPPTARLMSVYRLASGACAQLERAVGESLTNTLTTKAGKVVTHASNRAAAAKAIKRAKTLIARAVSLLDKAAAGSR